MKNPAMSIWLSWANRATTLWATAMTTAAQRNRAAMLKALTKPPKPSKPRRKPRSGAR